MGFRDSYGIRPLVLGSRLSDKGSGRDYMMASESVALKCLGYKNIVDVLPGQAVIIQRGHEPVFFDIQKQKAYSPDIFVRLLQTARTNHSNYPPNNRSTSISPAPTQSSTISPSLARVKTWAQNSPPLSAPPSCPLS